MLFLLGKQITWFLEIVCVFSPHLCVGFLFLVLYPVRLLLRSSSVCTLSYTQLCNTPSFTHTQLCHTPVCHTPSFTYNFVTNQLCHTHHLPHTHTSHTHNTPSFTRNFFTHQLYHTHTTLSHTIFHIQLCPTQLCHTQANTTLSHTNFVTHYLSHTNFVTHHLCHTPSFRYNFVTPHFVTHQLCHKLSFTLRARRGTCSHRPSFCVAGVTLMVG